MGEHRKSVGDGDLRRIVDRVRGGQTPSDPRQEAVASARNV
jgi:hypothetical protein